MTSNILLPIVEHENIYSSFEECVPVQGSFCSRVKPGFFMSFGKEESMSSEKGQLIRGCGMQNDRSWPSSLLYMLWSRHCTSQVTAWALPLGYFGRRRCTLLLVPSLLRLVFQPPDSFLDWRYVGWWTRVISESSVCLKMSQFFTHLTKTLPKPEILQPVQFLHQYLNIQARMSHFSEIVNNPKFRPSKVPNILLLNASRKLKSGSSLNCLGRKKKMFECC